jgi:hypothetical protein
MPAGATGTLLGLCLTVNCVAEVPVFYYSGALIKKLGVELAINLAMGAYCVRLAAYAVSRGDWRARRQRRQPPLSHAP